MTANESTDEARKAAIEDATTDKLEDVSPPMSPDLETDNIEYRADVGQGGWMVPPSRWKLGDDVYLRLKDDRTAGPFRVVRCHPPSDRRDKWRYDIKDKNGNMKLNISVNIMV